MVLKIKTTVHPDAKVFVVGKKIVVAQLLRLQ